MYNIAIADDDKLIVNEIKNIIENFFLNDEFKFKIDTITNSTDFQLDNNYDVIFLDIDMPQRTGFDIADELPEQSLIIFVSYHDNLAYQACNHHPFGFVRKSSLEQDIQPILMRIRTKLCQFLSVNDNNKILRIPFAQIMYIESIKHYLYIHTTNKTFKIRGSLCHISHNLTTNDFCIIHQSFIVHFKYINSIEKNDIILKDKTLLPISRKHYHDLYKKYHYYLLKEV